MKAILKSGLAEHLTQLSALMVMDKTKTDSFMLSRILLKHYDEPFNRQDQLE